SIDPSKKPATIDLTRVSPSALQHHGVYALDGDTLLLCHCRAAQERPKDLNSNEGAMYRYLCKRQRGSRTRSDDAQDSAPGPAGGARGGGPAGGGGSERTSWPGERGGTRGNRPASRTTAGLPPRRPAARPRWSSTEPPCPSWLTARSARSRRSCWTRRRSHA